MEQDRSMWLLQKGKSTIPTVRHPSRERVEKKQDGGYYPRPYEAQGTRTMLRFHLSERICRTQKNMTSRSYVSYFVLETAPTRMYIRSSIEKGAAAMELELNTCCSSIFEVRTDIHTWTTLLPSTVAMYDSAESATTAPTFLSSAFVLWHVSCLDPGAAAREQHVTMSTSLRYQTCYFHVTGFSSVVLNSN